ncbi:hypothetical protein PM082_004225 [Marasmius tenuissimus]|nr:hypothetical protein PM082_004225 [Marasmius tenuissimus]
MVAILPLPVFLLFFSALLLDSTAQAQGVATSVCNDTGLDYYVAAVGETPCRTYERVRQICDSNYQVGQMELSKTPYDTCDRENSDCCCNSITFALSMLCKTCQFGMGRNGKGCDGAAGTFEAYLTAGRPDNTSCSPALYKAVPLKTQSAICNQDIKLYDYLYIAGWSDGAWYYKWVEMRLLEAQDGDPDKILKKCPAVNAANTTTSVSPTSVTGAPSSRSSIPIESSPKPESDSSRAGVIVAISIGIAVVVAALVGSVCYLRRRRVNKTEEFNDSRRNEIETYWRDGIEPEPYSLHCITPRTLREGGVQTPSYFAGTIDHDIFTSTLGENADTSMTTTELERHLDAGPVMMGSSLTFQSGRLPPAYSDLLDVGASDSSMREGHKPTVNQ